MLNTLASQNGCCPIIEKLFPSCVSGIISPVKDFRHILNTEELDLIQSASEKRMLEFSTGRYCAKTLLATFGIENYSILSGDNREPIWPDQVIGSISHSNDLCGAVATSSTSLKSVGLDIERIKPLKKDIGRIVCTENEKKWIAAQKQSSYDLLVLIIFSLKEALYKCVFQRDKIKIGFSECEILPNTSNNIALSTIKRKDLSITIEMRFLIQDQYIFSSAFCRS